MMKNSMLSQFIFLITFCFSLFRLIFSVLCFNVIFTFILLFLLFCFTFFLFCFLFSFFLCFFFLFFSLFLCFSLLKSIYIYEAIGFRAIVWILLKGWEVSLGVIFWKLETVLQDIKKIHNFSLKTETLVTFFNIFSKKLV